MIKPNRYNLALEVKRGRAGKTALNFGPKAKFSANPKQVLMKMYLHHYTAA